MNQLFLIGRVYREPKRYEKEGRASAMFTVATSEKTGEKDELGKDKYKTSYVGVSAFGHAANHILKHWKEGAEFYIEATVADYKKADGTYKTGVTAKRIEILSTEPRGKVSSPVSGTKKLEKPAVDDLDGIPF